jgi:hypothetical protein
VHDAHLPARCDHELGDLSVLGRWQHLQPHRRFELEELRRHLRTKAADDAEEGDVAGQQCGRTKLQSRMERHPNAGRAIPVEIVSFEFLREHTHDSAGVPVQTDRPIQDLRIPTKP